MRNGISIVESFIILFVLFIDGNDLCVWCAFGNKFIDSIQRRIWFGILFEINFAAEAARCCGSLLKIDNQFNTIKSHGGMSGTEKKINWIEKPH